MFCTQCGAQIDDDARFCTECGAPVEEGEPHVTPATGPLPQPALDPEPSPAPQAPARRRVPIALVVAAALALVAVGVLGGLYAASAGPFAQAPASVPSGAPSTSPTEGQALPDAGAAEADPEPSSPSEDTAARTAVVPSLVGLTEDEALAGIKVAGLGIREVSHEPSDTVEKGRVILSSLAAGTSVEPGTWIDLVVSSGPAATRVEHRYTLVQEAMTWDDARAYCDAHGGHLVTITSAEEYDQVLALMPDSGDTAICWVGGCRAGDAWEWVTGEEFSFASWATGEPNNDGGTEDRLVLLRTPELTWGLYDVPNDVSAYYKPYRMGFVMEQEVEVS